MDEVLLELQQNHLPADNFLIQQLLYDLQQDQNHLMYEQIQVLLLGYGVASVDPVEVDVYGLGEVWRYRLVMRAILVVC